MTKYQRAHEHCLELLRNNIRTHSAPERSDRRGSNMTTAEAVSRARNGRKLGAKARRRPRYVYSKRHPWLQEDEG